MVGTPSKVTWSNSTRGRVTRCDHRVESVIESSLCEIKGAKNLHILI